MSILSSLGDLYQKISAGAANPEQHFSQVAQTAPTSSLANGLTAAFRSGETAPFAQMASQLFSNGNGSQQARVLNTLLSSVGPGVLASVGGGGLASLLQSGQSSVTPEQAAQISPGDVQKLAEHAEQHDPSIVERLSGVYAQHPVLVQSLGSAALGIIVKKMAETHPA